MKLLSLVLLAVTLSGCAIVGPGEKAVITHFGAVQEGTLNSGIYLWIPVARGISTFDVRVQKNVIETTAASKDLQNVHSNVAVNWRIAAKDLGKFYQDVGDEDDAVQKLLIPAVSEVLKSASAKMTAEEIIGKRAELKKNIDDSLRGRLAPYGIEMKDVSIVNIDFSQEFSHAIEQKQIAEQQAKQAHYLAEKATQDAQAAVNQAKGQAASQQLIRSSITPEILRKMAIEKWDGHFPQYMGGQLPFLQLTGK